MAPVDPFFQVAALLRGTGRSTSAAPATSTTTGYVAAEPRCTADRLTVTVAVYHPSYTPGQIVYATLTVHNKGPGVCW